jgi:N-acetylglucosamine kinase-like BadF-type ATPase
MTTHLKRAVLALDAGGSKCDAALVHEDGTVVGYGHVQRPGLSGRSLEIARAASAQAIGRHTFDELHVATYASTLPAGIIDPDHGERVRVWSLTQTDGPLGLVGETSGVVVVAGTGALVSARTRQGRTLALDGLGPILGDFGSGYSIGLQALRAAARAAMHPSHHTSLKERVFTACELLEHDAPQRPSQIKGDSAEAMAREKQQALSRDRDRLQRLVAFSLTPQDRSTLASFAKIVDEEARRGDAQAIRLLQDAAAAIRQTVYDLLDHLQIDAEEYVLVGTGGVAMNSDVFWNHLCQLLRESAPRLTPTRCTAAPVLGNALCVLRELFPEAVDTIRKTLLATAPKGDAAP